MEILYQLRDEKSNELICKTGTYSNLEELLEIKKIKNFCRFNVSKKILSNIGFTPSEIKLIHSPKETPKLKLFYMVKCNDVPTVPTDPTDIYFEILRKDISSIDEVLEIKKSKKFKTFITKDDDFLKFGFTPSEIKLIHSPKEVKE